MIKDSVLTEDYAIYNSDCMYVLAEMPDESVDMTIYSPPFAGLYHYSSSPNDFSNSDSRENFLEKYNLLIAEKARVTKKGRMSLVHVTEIVDNTGGSWDFPAKVIELHAANGFEYKGRITIWKEPLKVRMRTMVQSLMHKFIVEDSTKCFPDQPDYLLIFKKKGESEIPVTHPSGMIDYEYFGETPFLPAHTAKYGDYQTFRRKCLVEGNEKLSHLTWQRYASSVWDDIRIDNVLDIDDTKENDDEKHVHPLQLDVIFRAIYLWSNPNETVLTPFMGVGSEVFGAVALGRKGIGIELKQSYFKQAANKHLPSAKTYFNVPSQLSIF